jgi:hypothetical protein
VIRVGAQRPRIEVVPAQCSTAADDVIVMAAKAGMVLDDWQQHVLRGALGEDDNGRWSAFEAALVVPRQAGKSAVLEALILTSLLVWQEQTVIYSAHLFSTAAETFQRLRALIESSEFADEVAKVYTANGKEAIILKNGCRVKFMARSRGGGRGFSGDRIIFDEAFDLDPKSLGAMIPTLAARSMRGDSNPQIWYASSAPHSDSIVLHSLRARAATSDPGRLYYAEWSAPTDPPPDLSDVDAWYIANPALGIRISEDFVRDELRALQHSPNEFLRERLGIPDPLYDDTVSRDPKIPAEAWEATATTEHVRVEPGEVVLAFDCSPGGEWSSIAIAAGDTTSPYVELVEHRGGTTWLPERLVELAQRWRPTVVVSDGVGPVGSVIGSVFHAFRQAGVDTEVLKQLSTKEYKAACGLFFSDVTEHRLRRPPNQGPLDLAVADATERRLGEAWAWDRRSATVPISPLVAATIARSQLSLPVDTTTHTTPFVSLDDF